MYKKILLSSLVVVVAAAIVVGATTAFFSDTETSRGNTFTAGAIDLGIDNTSYYNGEPNSGTSWDLTFDLDDKGAPYLFFNFADLKPGDWGEDTISIHVNNNDAWVCADVTLDTSVENTITEPEADMQDNAEDGELDDEVYFWWWADDGDNVLEVGENLLPGGSFSQLGVNNTATVALADSSVNIWDGSGPVVGAKTYYIGKYWCYGKGSPNPVPAGTGQSPVQNSGFNCSGASVSNISQSDSMTATISFRAEQWRNNPDFKCSVPTAN